MTMMTPRKQQSDGIFFYLLILTVFFLLLEISFFIQCNRAYLSDYTFVSDNLHIPITILPGIAFFLFAQLSLHFAYCVFVWLVAESLYAYLPTKIISRLGFAAFLWVLGLLTILSANQHFYPNSKFAGLTSLILVNQALATNIFYLLVSCCLLILLASVMSIVHRLMYKPVFYLTIIGLIISYQFKESLISSSSPIDVATNARPNIILIGIDSLRPDFLSYFGYDRKTPFFDSFLEEASVLTEAITPLARTFPSWTGILTGQYPREINVRSNLARQDSLNLTQTLPAILQRNGYQTIFATDETRFSNIDKNFGFDQIISPPMGLNDFLIGNFNDFPMSNLLINTNAGRLLFPHSYANRPVYFVYNPDSFLQLLKKSLPQHRDKPLFLATHFCLPHYPYLWGSLSGRESTPQERYVESIVRVDQQVRDFFTLLSNLRLLDHAIVVLLSDHGEALEFSGDRITEPAFFLPASKPVPEFYPPSLDDEAVNQSAGHGTDVLGLPQYHSVLAFKLYGTGEQKPSLLSGVVTLLDIKPTILDLLQLPLTHSSGVSLVAAIRNGILSLQSRHLFLESDFSPEAIRTVYPEIRKVMLAGIDLFQINPTTTRLTLKKEMTAKIIRSKQYADIYGEWMLALYPQNNLSRMPILINLNTGVWTNDLSTSFAQQSPAASMLSQLKSFYGSEINQVQ